MRRDEPRSGPRGWCARAQVAQPSVRHQTVDALCWCLNGRVGAQAASLAAVAAATATLITTAPAHAAPMAASLHPGAALTIGNELCTAGFVARNQHGAPVMFTAGHCDVGQRVQAGSASTGLVPAGDIVASAYGGSVGEDPDIAVMKLTGSINLDPNVDANLPVGGTAPIIANGMTLCKQGATTGRSCGPVIESSQSKVKFAARIAPGDSGGPVWGYTSTGSIFAVGITIRQSNDGYPVAEMIDPWLQRWNLTID